MAVSPLLYKALIGAGAASTLVVGGGVYLYTRQSSGSLDDFALNSQSSDWTWTPTDNNISTTSNQDTIVEIAGTLTGKDSNKGKTWTCKIKGIVPSNITNPTFKVKEQVDELKQQISNSNKFKNFLNNCIRHRTINLANDVKNSEITIDFGNLEKVSSSYKFKESDFSKLYEGEYWTQELKEKQVNISCTRDSCQKIENNNPKGLENIKGNLTITKDTQEDPERFDNGTVYTISGTANQNGDYQLVKDVSGSFLLKKVEILTLEEIWKKLKLTCTNGQSSACQVQSGWETIFYQDSSNYAQVGGLTAVNVDTNATANNQYYGGHKFTFTGTSTTSNPTEGSISISCDKGHTIKYVKPLGYVFLQIEQ